MTIKELEEEARNMYRNYILIKKEIKNLKVQEFCERHPEVINDLIILGVLPKFLRKEVKKWKQ